MNMGIFISACCSCLA